MVVLPSDANFVQIDWTPVKLFVCRKDLQFGTLMNLSDWDTFNE